VKDKIKIFYFKYIGEKFAFHLFNREDILAYLPFKAYCLRDAPTV